MQYSLVILFILKNIGFGLGQVTINVSALKYENSTILNNQNINNNVGGGTATVQEIPNAPQGVPYFGVEFRPDVEIRPNNPSVDEIKKMLRVILTRSNSILTYSMGQWDPKQTVQWAPDSYSTATVAAQLNNHYNKQVLSFSQEASILLDGENSPQPDIDYAFLAAQKANGIFFNTIWSITFRIGAGHVEDQQSGRRAITEIRKHQPRAHGMGLKVGIKLNICGDIQGGPNQLMLTELATTVDFFVCSIYPPFAIAEPSEFANYVTSTVTTYKTAFGKVAPNLEIIFRTGLASEGDSYKNPAYMNSPQKVTDLWDKIQSWAEKNKVRVFMHEAFDTIQSVGGNDGHSGYWKALGNGNYVEKGTGQIVNV